jgi:hypothetical protein
MSNVYPAEEGRTARLNLSIEMVAYEHPIIEANSSLMSHTNILQTDLQHDSRFLRHCRSAMIFLDSMKNKDQHAARLKKRDSETMELCKSYQRRYISGLRQRHNGKFSSESATLPTFKIRAPPLSSK